MDYTDKDGKTYVASQSLDKRMRRLELWMTISTAVRVFEIIALIGVLWWVDRNNFLSQLLTSLSICRGG